MITGDTLEPGDVNAGRTKHQLICSRLPGPVSAVLMTLTVSHIHKLPTDLVLKLL